MADGPGTPTIAANEHHPAADSAYRWLKGYMVEDPLRWLQHKEALASTALSGNRQAEICMGTIDRLAKGEPVSDRYLLGLAWTILNLDNFEQMESTAAQRLDPANPKTENELQ
jgi:hypothetical protein